MLSKVELCLHHIPNQIRFFTDWREIREKSSLYSHQPTDETF